MRTTLKHIETVVDQINMAALELGMLKENEVIQYSGGNVANGISADVYVTGTLGAGFSRTHVSFLPEFNYKMTRSQHYVLLETTLRALYGVLKVTRQK